MLEPVGHGDTGPAAHGLRTPGRPQPPHPAVIGVLVVASYVALAMTADLHAWAHGGALLQQGGSGDLAQEVWFLGSLPWTLLHGHNPLFSDWVNYPTGANMLVNTSMLLPATVLAPVTVVFGPIVTFNVLLVLGVASSATAACFVLHRFVGWWASYAAGLVYGFSPYMMGAGYGHLFLLLAPFPPLVVLALHDLLVGRRMSTVRAGVSLGLLVALQFFVSTEVLASSALVIGLSVAVLAGIHRRRLRAAAAPAVRGLLVAAATFLVLCAYPLVFLLSGPEHIRGPEQPVAVLAPIRSDLLGPVVPTTLQRFQVPSIAHYGISLLARGGAVSNENTIYVGVPLLAFCLVTAVVLRRRLLVQLGTAVAGIGFLFALGARLDVARHVTPVPLPFAVLGHLPVVDSFVALRFSLFVFLGAAMLFAAGLDHLAGWLRSRRPRRRYAVQTWCALVAVCCLLPIVPRWPYQQAPVDVPAFFTSPAVSEIPVGSVVATYPYADSPSTQPMIWQVTDHMRYRIPGGEMIFANLDGTSTFYGILPPGAEMLMDCYDGDPLPHVSPAVEAQWMWVTLTEWRADTAVATPVGADPGCALRLFALVLGPPQKHVGGVDVWFGVRAILSRGLRGHAPPVSPGRRTTVP